MARRKENPQKAAMRDMMSVLLEGVLDEELDEELGYSKYDILIACVDGLTGFPQAIEAVYPKTEIQQCIIHQIRNSTKFVSYKDIKNLMADLKLVYAAPKEETALNELEAFGEKWDCN